MKSVSILTPTTINRKNFLKFVAQAIANQDYKNIIEWIIVDGTKEGNSDLEITISEIRSIKNIPDVIFHKQNLNRNNNIGALRNLLNDNAKGDIMIFFDDDDFYFDKRVSHTVNKLNESGCDLAACSAMYMYDNDFRYLYKFNSYGPNHGLACTMGFTKNYLINNRFDDTKECAEETSFTNGFKNKLVQLDAKNVIIHSSHTNNTFNKKKNIILENLHIPKDDRRCMLTPISNSLYSFCKNKKFVKQYLKLVNIEITKSKYDIVYFCGLLGRPWHPNDSYLDEPEQAMVTLSSVLVSKGYTVAIFANFTDDVSVNGVDFINYSKFRTTMEYNIIILWRFLGLISFFKFNNIKFNKLFLDLYDNNLGGNEKLLIDNIDSFKKIIFKSNFQINFLIDNIKNNYCKESITNISANIPSGINKNILANINNINREKLRFCYSNSYGNGLPYLLLFFFSTIKKMFPESEFHIYNGMDDIQNDEFKQKLIPLFNQPGVVEHGKQSFKIILDEKYKSTFHLYYTSATSDVDCVSIKESVFCGCIPILSKHHIFNDSIGIHLDGDPSDPQSHVNAALQLSQMIKQNNFIKKKQYEIVSSSKFMDWNDVANKWIKHF